MKWAFFGSGDIFTATLIGYSLKEANINTKILNFSSNISALVVFVGFYQVLWVLGILMGAGIGAFLGSKLVLKTNGRFIKAVFLVWWAGRFAR